MAKETNFFTFSNGSSSPCFKCLPPVFSAGMCNGLNAFGVAKKPANKNRQNKLTGFLKGFKFFKKAVKRKLKMHNAMQMNVMRRNDVAIKTQCLFNTKTIRNACYANAITTDIEYKLVWAESLIPPVANKVDLLPFLCRFCKKF